MTYRVIQGATDGVCCAASEGVLDHPHLAVLDAMPDVCAAEPGLQTYLEMPLVAGRARIDLHGDRDAGDGRA